MKRYEKYIHNDSVILATLPEGWRYLPLKYIAKFYTGNSLNDKEKDQFSETVGEALPYIATKDISPIRQSADYNNGISIPKSEISYKVAPKDSFLICIEGGSAGRKMTYLTQDVCFVNKLCCIDAKESKKFLYYAFQSAPFQSDFKQSLQGLIGGVSISKLSDMRFAIPSLEEQQKIAVYLDYKTGKIDILTEMLTTRIDDLKKYRQSVISEVVTRGLDKSAKLKYSGVDWIGRIPEHWTPLRCGLLFKMGSGTTPKSGNDSYYCEDGKHWLQTGDLTDGLVYETSKHLSDKAFEDYSLAIYPKGSVVIAMYGATIGKLGILDIDAATNQACCVFTESERMINRFAYYCLMASRESLKSFANGGGQPNISQAQLKDWKLPVPPIGEQMSIVEYLDRKTKQIDDTISATEQQIKDLQTYRISLISEAVTGQIDVRDWRAPLE